ncbi:MAG: hypothetical protein A2X05_06905 [Bacteroidetes bacterium GWE2_41_25]|nr:MAG: hypothetical protein A2X03_15345 [Bacteroidetes bacterium GWA2_40_15]OFX91089.1 MAG: hypothetical protein A2X06_13700 [Bacteroidetes bacterium GWC2_40_22]OFX95820.1 MAG: hypothetical protein A2X05_06905 [Bacteroidetes bacterium GWE2_41_25]OFY60284.1 MAG: hypothetical protein A2X04_03365 [Bacteroidetes bacterium GWF2_41_9]HAM10166.1 hypothetical protein [Bacteroidales bacterium]
MKYRVYFFFIIFFPVYSFSQETRLSESIISIAEELAADESDPEAISLYIEKLFDLFENPVMINSADQDEISRLFFLTDFQVKILSGYIKSSGKIISVYELANLPGFEKETALMMIPFISLGEVRKENAYHSAWRNTLITNIIWKPEYKDSSLLGSQVKILTKYKFSANGFSGGITAEKDQGEELLQGNPPLPDLLSGHVAWSGKGLIRRIVIGDYSARFGQGTNINTSIHTGLSLHAPGYMSARSEIRPYTSTDENNFFRGAGAEFSISNLSASFFYSRNSIDATLSTEPDSEYIKSFYTSGLHNTSSSLLKKDVITNLVYGINLSYNLRNLRIGTTWSEERFSLPVRPDLHDPEKIFAFDGNSNSVYSIYYNSLINKILLYGEFSVNNLMRHAVLQGLTIRPSDRLSINLFFRHYDEGYFSFHGNGPGGSSNTGTGKSILGNFMFEAAKHLFISGGCEVQEFPWLRYRTSSPSYRIKRAIRMRFVPNDNLLIESSYYYNMTTADSDEKNRIPELKNLTTRSLSTTFRYSLSENLTMGTRIYYKLAEQKDTRGMILLQEMNYRFGKLPLTLWLRYCLFNTDDWDTRIYTYENDLLYSYSIPALYGRGSRSYLMAGWKLSDKADVRFKYGVLSKLQTGNIYAYSEEFRLQIRLFI